MFQKSDGAQYAQTSLVNLSVEEENLAAIPFAVLERRVGKRIGKLEIQGTKVLPDGSQARVTWQVQGNNELGLPTEQDLDIFIALGVLTFQNNFQKTVSFSGREIAKILNISSVHVYILTIQRHPITTFSAGLSTGPAEVRLSRIRASAAVCRRPSKVSINQSLGEAESGGRAINSNTFASTRVLSSCG